MLACHYSMIACFPKVLKFSRDKFLIKNVPTATCLAAGTYQ